MRAIRPHGGVKRRHHPYWGMNGRFGTLQAAVLLAKLPHFEWEVAERARIGSRYNELLADCAVVPVTQPRNTHVHAQYSIQVPDRDAFGAKLTAAGMPTAVYYPKCLHEQPVFVPLWYGPRSFPESERVARSVISFPMHPFLAEADQDCVVEVVQSYSSKSG